MHLKGERESQMQEGDVGADGNMKYGRFTLHLTLGLGVFKGEEASVGLNMLPPT